MASGEAGEEKRSDEGSPGKGEAEEGEEEGGEEKRSKDSVEVAGADAMEEKKVTGVGGGEERKSRRGRKPKGGPGRPKGEAAGRKASKKRALGEAKPAVERPTRERKTVERFSVTSPQRAVASKAVTIQQGTGTKLKDIPNVFFKLSKRRVDENLQLLHTILFAKRAKALYVKRNIYQFSGFVWTENEEKQRAKVKEKLDKCVKDKLLDFCDILDIPVSKATTKKEEMSAKLLEFLESPHVTRDTILAEKEQKGRKRKWRSQGTSEVTSGDADSDREAKKRKKSNVSSALKKGHKNSPKVMEEDEEEGGSAEGTGVDSDINQNEGVAEGSDDENNGTEDEGDEQEPVVDKKVSTQKQKGRGRKSTVNLETTVNKDSPTKPAKSSSRSSSDKSPSEGKGRVSEKLKKGSSMEQSKRGSKASTKQEAEPTKKSSVKSDKSASSSRRSAKNDSGPSETSKLKGDKSKADEDKKKGQPGPSGSAKKQGKERASGNPEPTREEIHAVVRDVLKEVDFNTATLADILRQLGSRFDVDLMHRKAEVKSIIEEVINDMTDDEDEDDA